MADDIRERLVLEDGEEISRWIMRIELYAASQGWNDKKTAGKAALNLPSDKLDVLLALPTPDRSSWAKIKAILLAEFQPTKSRSEKLFLQRRKKDGESYLVYSKHLERLYRESFALASDSELSDQSSEAIKRQFLRGINSAIAQKLQLDHPTQPVDKLALRAKEIEEIMFKSGQTTLCRTDLPSLSSLQSEIHDIKMVVQSLADSASGGHVSGGQDHVGAVKKPFHPPPQSHTPSAMERKCHITCCGKGGVSRIYLAC